MISNSPQVTDFELTEDQLLEASRTMGRHQWLGAHEGRPQCSCGWVGEPSGARFTQHRAHQLAEVFTALARQVAATAWLAGHRFTGFDPARGENPYDPTGTLTAPTDGETTDD